MCQRRGAALVSFLAVLLLGITGCGGGGGVGNPGGAAAPSSAPSAQVKTLTVLGDNQSGLPGDLLRSPVQAVVQDAQGFGVSGVRVTFSSPDALEIMPSSVVTTQSGIARALIRLPNVPLRTFTLNVSTSTGHTGHVSFASGPRVVGSYGNISGSTALVADGRTIGRQILTSDGMLQESLHLPDGRVNCGEFVTCGFAIFGNNWLLPRDLLMFFDDQFRLQRVVDLAAINGYPNTHLNTCCSVPDKVDPDGTMYFHTQGKFFRFRPDGSEIDEVEATLEKDDNTWMTEHAFVKANGNYVALVRNLPVRPNGSFYSLREFTKTGALVRRQEVDGDQMATDTSGRVLVVEVRGNAAWYDENFNLLSQFIIHYPGAFTPFTPGKLLGIDSQGNIAFGGDFRTFKADPSGKMLWSAGDPLASPDVPLTFENRVPEGTSLRFAAAHPLSRTVYACQIHECVKYVNGSYGETITLPEESGVAYVRAASIDSGGNIYWAMSNGAIWVSDASGNVLRRNSYAQIQSPFGIGIGPDSTKYVLDKGNKSIHVIDAADVYQRAVPLLLPLPSSDSFAPGRFSICPDGNLMVADDTTIKKVAPNGTELWTKEPGRIYSLGVDSKNRVFVGLGGKLLVLDAGGNTITTAAVPMGNPDQNGPEASVVFSAGGQVFWVANGRIYELSGD